MSKDTVNDIVQTLLFILVLTWLAWRTGNLPVRAG